MSIGLNPDLRCVNPEYRGDQGSEEVFTVPENWSIGDALRRHLLLDKSLEKSIRRSIRLIHSEHPHLSGQIKLKQDMEDRSVHRVVLEITGRFDSVDEWLTTEDKIRKVVRSSSDADTMIYTLVKPE